MKLPYFKIVVFLLTMSFCLAGCQDDDNASNLGPVTDVTWTPTSGGAIISFIAPESNDLLYIKAVYTNSLGKEVFNVVSIYEQQIEITGLADENKEYTVYLYAVDKNGGESPVQTIMVKPERSYVNVIYDNLEIFEIVGGVEVRWTNPSGAEVGGKTVYVTLNYNKPGDNEVKTRYLSSSQMDVKIKVRGLEPATYEFSYIVEDLVGNHSLTSQKVSYNINEEVTIPKYVEDENGFRTYLWTLVADQTTLKEVHENRNDAIFDGVIDDKAKANDNSYAGTNADQYGPALPWNTDQMDIVVDLHQTINISRIRAWQRAHWYGWSNYAQSWRTDGISEDYNFYQGENIKSFDLYGSMDAQNWFKIQECDISTNTTAGRLPVYETRSWYSFEQGANYDVWMPNQTSYDVALEGHLWELETMSPEVRFIRVRFTSNWDQSQRTVSGLSEITLYGAIIQENKMEE